MKTFKNWQLPDHAAAARRTRAAVERVDAFMIPASAVNIGAGKTYYISTYGCQANERDSETIAGILDTLGFAPADKPDTADVVILNTCAIRENASDKVVGEIGALKRFWSQNKNMVIGVCGCMSQEEGFVERLLEKYPWVHMVFGTHNIQELPAMLTEAMDGQKVVKVYSREGEVYENLPVRRFGEHKAWVNIMYGCDKFCTYCIVPYTRGKQRSRTPENILKEIQELKEQGYQEITLLGQNVNAYGKDLEEGISFASLLEQAAQTGIPRIRFMTSHPWDFSPEMIDTIARYDNIMPFVHLPLQSGDTEVLKRMNRRYSAEDYRALFDQIKEKVPGVSISTDIIVGFPGETDEQFEHTLDMVRHCQFDSAFTFIFSPRPGTPAAKMEDETPLEVKKERLFRLNELWGQYALEKNKAFEGRVLEVLVDGPSRKDENVWSGYSRENRLVNFTGENLKPGMLVNVYIDKAKTYSLDGHAL